MRKSFFKRLANLAERDQRIWLITADMGWKLLDDFPRDRYVNVGVAEQNMVGIATGLALECKIPFCYSISTFLIFRAYEFIRNDVAYQNLPVRIVGVGGWNEYPAYGISHNCIQDEDLALIRTLPQFDIVDGETQDVCEELEKSLDSPFPIYFRLKRKGV